MGEETIVKHMTDFLITLGAFAFNGLPVLYIQKCCTYKLLCDVKTAAAVPGRVYMESGLEEDLNIHILYKILFFPKININKFINYIYF